MHFCPKLNSKNAMKKLIQILFILLAIQSFGQKKKEAPAAKKVDYWVPITPEKWEFQQGKVTFADYKEVKAMKLAPNSGQVVLKDVVFKDGTIEFDIEPIAPEFAESIYFHRKDLKEQEIVYLRFGAVGNKLSNAGIQYTPYFDGVNMWDMYPEYQAPAMAKAGEWNHFKLIISGKRLQVFLNNAPKPVLDIPELEGSLSEGSIAFEGSSYIANVQLKPNEVENLSPVALPDLTDHDGFYLRKWALTAPQEFPDGSELSAKKLPQPDLFMDSISTERRGLVNLTRKYGASKGRRVVWLKTKILAKEAMKTDLQLGFSDEVWVFLNNQMILVDKNLYSQNMRKYPDGRISVQNTSTLLNLRKGENDLLIGVSNDFYGWGIMARLASGEGIGETDIISSIYKLAKEISTLELEPYVGTYSSTEMPFKLTFVKKGKVLIAQATGQEPVEMQTLGNHNFAYATGNVIFEFNPGNKKVILRQGNDSKEFVRE
jgi:hypothetical protein